MAKGNSFYFVDDDPDMIVFVTAQLEAAGHKVASNTGSAEALSATLSDNPACVCLDLLVPDLGGRGM